MNTDLSPGAKFGAYILEDRIGRGGFGTVWRAHYETSGEPVALKVLGGAYSESDTTAIRAEVELLAGAAARRSAHVVRVVDGGVEPAPYIVMEFVHGEDLLSRLRRQKTLSVEETLEVGLAITDALDALNEVGIIHRDIKPANVMLGEDGIIKLADFGIAKIVGYETVTMGGEIAMTMAYAAPEVWDNGAGPYGRPSNKSDLYAMGILLYECLVGSPPFRGEYGSLYRDHHEALPDFSRLPPETPASIFRTIRLCLEKDPALRPDSAKICYRYLRRAAIELAEGRGQPPASEPKRFGAWLRISAHPGRPWSWHCRHGSTALEATVEVHFLDHLDQGTFLRNTVAANPALVPLGAERLIEANRLILRPNEEWQEPPPGQFQFWVAREERDASPPPAAVGAAELRSLATSLLRLIEVANKESVSLCFAREDVSVLPGGKVLLHRPGLDAPLVDSEAGALSFLRSLALDVQARALVAVAPDLRTLAGNPAPLAAGDVTTMYAGAPTVVLGSSVVAASAATPAQLLACPRCGAILSANDGFCGDCGTPTGSYNTLLCPTCRAPCLPTDIFCPGCGRNLRPSPA